MLGRRSFALFLAAMSCHARADSRPQAGAAAPSAARAALALADGRPDSSGKAPLTSLSAPGAPGQTFELAIGSCREGKCPLLVSLVQGGHRLAERPLPWSSASPEASEQDAEPGWGSTDPLEVVPVKAWVTGEEATFLATMVRPLALAPNIGGVLIDQIAGFEHLKRSHVVFAVYGKDLVKAWSAEEGAGWTFSATAPVALGSGRDGVAYFDRFDSSIDSDTQPDTLDAQVLSWDARTRTLLPYETTGLLSAVVVGQFASVRAAKQARQTSQGCLGAFWILPASRFPATKLRNIALVRVTSVRAAADRLSAATLACARGKKVMVTALR